MKIIISGGGTGGHVFPAISIGQALLDIHPDCELLFVGARGKLEMQKVPAAGFNIIGLPVTGFQRRLTYRNALFFWYLLVSMIKSRAILKKFKPDAVVGVGGYASGPVLRMAAWRNIPVLIQEQNSYAGITNRLMAGKAAKICVAYHGMEKYFPADRIVFTGNPVRKDILDLKDKNREAMEFFDLDKEKKVLLVLGGSLGARTINESIMMHLDKLLASNIQLIWQTGKGYYRQIREVTKAKSATDLKIMDFISRMDHAYAAADVIVSRAGAGTISELCLVAKPVVLVPSPNVAEDHQTHNARALKEINGGELVTDGEAGEKLVDTILSLIRDEARCRQFSGNIRKLAMPEASEDIAREIIRMIA